MGYFASRSTRYRVLLHLVLSSSTLVFQSNAVAWACRDTWKTMMELRLLRPPRDQCMPHSVWFLAQLPELFSIQTDPSGNWISWYCFAANRLSFLSEDLHTPERVCSSWLTILPILSNLVNWTINSQSSRLSTPSTWSLSFCLRTRLGPLYTADISEG